MTPGVGRLRDIHSLDPMSWWPPAIGWWLVALALVLVAVGLRYAWLWWAAVPRCCMPASRWPS